MLWKPIGQKDLAQYMLTLTLDNIYNWIDASTAATQEIMEGVKETPMNKLRQSQACFCLQRHNCLIGRVCDDWEDNQSN